FPLLVYAVGTLSSMVSTSLVGRLATSGGSAGAMKAINNSFRLGALMSLIGFTVVGFGYLRFDGPYIVQRALEKGLGSQPEVRAVLAEKITPRPESGPDLAGVWAHLPAEAQAALAESKVTYRNSGPGGETELTLVGAAQQLVPVPVGLEIRPVIACLIGIVLTLLLN